MGYFRPECVPKDPDAAHARRDAKLVLLVANCALRGQGGTIDPATLRAIAEDPRMTPRIQRRATTALLRLSLAPGFDLPWGRGRA